MMFALQYHSPDEDLLMAFMKDIILESRAAGTCKSLAALLTHFADLPFHEAFDALARLGDMEVKLHDK